MSITDAMGEAAQNDQSERSQEKSNQEEGNQEEGSPGIHTPSPDENQLRELTPAGPGGALEELRQLRERLDQAAPSKTDPVLTVKRLQKDLNRALEYITELEAEVERLKNE